MINLKYRKIQFNISNQDNRDSLEIGIVGDSIASFIIEGKLSKDFFTDFFNFYDIEEYTGSKMYEAMDQFYFEIEEFFNYTKVTIRHSDVYIIFLHYLTNYEIGNKITCEYDGLVFWYSHDIYHVENDVIYGRVETSGNSELNAHKRALRTCKYLKYEKYKGWSGLFDMPETDYLCYLTHLFIERFGKSFKYDLVNLFNIQEPYEIKERDGHSYYWL